MNGIAVREPYGFKNPNQVPVFAGLNVAGYALGMFQTVRVINGTHTYLSIGLTVLIGTVIAVARVLFSGSILSERHNEIQKEDIGNFVNQIVRAGLELTGLGAALLVVDFCVSFFAQPKKGRA
jgi:hypothetical protein